MLEAEAARTFQQNHLVVQLAEDGAGEEVVGSSEKGFFAHKESVGVSRHRLTNTDELGDAALLAEVVHLTVKLIGLFSALVNITEDEGSLPSPSVHEVKRNVQ